MTEKDAFAVGTFRTSRTDAGMSAVEGRADEGRALVDCRFCRVGPGNFTPSLSQIRT
jgi:hypothetical protein